MIGVLAPDDLEAAPPRVPEIGQNEDHGRDHQHCPQWTEPPLEFAASLAATPQQVALAWQLQRSSATVLIPGTSSRAHLRENIAAADLALPADAVAELDKIGR